MKFSNIMIVTDLDGTFGSSSIGPAPANLAALEYFKKNGGIFTVASGRVPSAMGVWESVPTLVNAPAILCNGGFCYDFSRGERLMQIELDHKKAIEAVTAIREEFPDVNIRCSLSGSEIRVSGDEDFCAFTGWTRVSFDADSDMLDLIRERLESRYSEYFAFMKPCDVIYEFQASDATKGQALDRLRAYLSESGRLTDKLKLYAVGDYDNDLDMLAHCDVPACPANANDKVKKVAAVHLCHCRDGAIADLISLIENGEA